MVSANLILIGETGVGKSSLGNFILGKEVFPVSDNPKSETKKVKGEYGEGNKKDTFVIDTPNLDKEHLTQIIYYIKHHPGIQVFPRSNLWSHVALVWTKYEYYSFLPESKKKRIENQKKAFIKQFVPEIIKIVKSTNKKCNDETIYKFPTFFVDTDFKMRDEISCEEIDKLLDWVHSLDSINPEKIKITTKNKDPIREKEPKKIKNNSVGQECLVMLQEPIQEVTITLSHGNISKMTSEYVKANIESFEDIATSLSAISPCAQVVLGIYYLKEGNEIKAEEFLIEGCSDKYEGYYYALLYIDEETIKQRHFSKYSKKNAANVVDYLVNHYKYFLKKGVI
ncbi:hypothetical protein PIROE2DRAFT_56991 [Piromyces sp. E2]|nr:hypothetical protein PIROE2DRAFT_56991 [Piromyces sp. E2]|eukprot:OUM70116.1 hypothetical protein PIROE2DRAFT_56991 [Piromyces sp. E2]